MIRIFFDLEKIFLIIMFVSRILCTFAVVKL